MNQINTLMVAVFIALGVMLVAALAADIPVVRQEAYAMKTSQHKDDGSASSDQILPVGNTSVIL